MGVERQTRWKDSSQRTIRRRTKEVLKDQLLKKVKRGRQWAILELVENKRRLNTHLPLQVRMRLMLLVIKVQLPLST